MRARALALCMLTLAAPALAQNKQPGTIGIWSNNPTPNSLTDTGNARAPADFTVTGNLTVQGNIIGLPTTPSAPAGMPSVATNSALRSRTGMQVDDTVYRAGFWAAADGGGAVYTYSDVQCSLTGILAGGVRGNDGTQVQGSAGGCWNLGARGGAIPVEVWGALASRPDNRDQLTYAFKSGVPVYLSGKYRSSGNINLGAPLCPTIIGASPWSSQIIFSTTGTAGTLGGLGINCTPPAAGNAFDQNRIRLANFGLLTTQAGGGRALFMEVQVDLGQWIEVTAPTAIIENMLIAGDKSQTAWWSNGIVANNLGIAIFQNNFIYGVPGNYVNMTNGILYTQNVTGRQCDAARYFQNNVWNAEYAIHHVSLTGSSPRGCEGPIVANNNLLQDGYAVYIDAGAINQPYSPPGNWVVNNQTESVHEGIYLKKLNEAVVTGNLVYIGKGYNPGSPTAENCITFDRVQTFWLEHNYCNDIRANVRPVAGTTAINITGNSAYGFMNENFSLFMPIGVHLGSQVFEVWAGAFQLKNGGGNAVEWIDDAPPIAGVPRNFHAVTCTSAPSANFRVNKGIVWQC